MTREAMSNLDDVVSQRQDKIVDQLKDQLDACDMLASKHSACERQVKEPQPAYPSSWTAGLPAGRPVKSMPGGTVRITLPWP